MLEGSILQKLEAAHRMGQAGKRPLNFGVYYKNTLVALCHALEDGILTSRSAPLVIAAFQQGKWYLQEAERYGELAERARHITILAGSSTGFAEHQTSQRSNVALVELEPGDPVAQEWHLMILSPTYTAMVLCQELSAEDYGPQGPPTEDRERKFYGFWTFEAGLVREAVDLAIAHVGHYDPALQQQLTTLTSAIATESQAVAGEEVSDAVFRVVDYLQTSQQDLSPLAKEIHLDDNLVSNELQAFLRMAQLIDLADPNNPMAAAEVAALTEMMGQLLDLPAWQIQRLRLSSLLHRIGPLQVSQSVFNSVDEHTQDEAPYCPLACPLVPGVQALRTMPRLRAIAQIISHQTEWWNGSGQPAELARDEIPLESRILGLAAEFQQQLTYLQSEANTETVSDQQDALAQALAYCQAEARDRWDPELVDILALVVSGLQQGMSLAVQSPKVTAGMWLLDPPLRDKYTRSAPDRSVKISA